MVVIFGVTARRVNQAARNGDNAHGNENDRQGEDLHKDDDARDG